MERYRRHHIKQLIIDGKYTYQEVEQMIINDMNQRTIFDLCKIIKWVYKIKVIAR